MPNNATFLIAYVLEKSEGDPISTRVAVLRSLAGFLPEKDREPVAALARDLAAIEHRARQLTLTLTHES